MLSDDDLVLLALNAHDEPHQYHETLRGMNPSYLDGWRRAVRAVREVVAELRPAALCPDVAPLEAGDVVTIPDAGDPDQCVVARLSAGGLLVTGFACLDAAGVAALKLACARWQAAQGGEQ